MVFFFPLASHTVLSPASPLTAARRAKRCTRAVICRRENAPVERFAVAIQCRPGRGDHLKTGVTGSSPVCSDLADQRLPSAAFLFFSRKTGLAALVGAARQAVRIVNNVDSSPDCLYIEAVNRICDISLYTENKSIVTE